MSQMCIKLKVSKTELTFFPSEPVICPQVSGATFHLIAHIRCLVVAKHSSFPSLTVSESIDSPPNVLMASRLFRALFG